MQVKKPEKSSRIAGFHNLSLDERIEEIKKFANLNSLEITKLKEGLPIEVADKMIECVGGVYGLPLAFVPNFRMNNKDYIVPIAVEEPSIVSGLSFAGKISRAKEGIRCSYAGSHMTGQVLLREIKDTHSAILTIAQKNEEILAHANELEIYSKIIQVGGGVKSIETKILGNEMIAVNFAIDVKEAHGANFITRMMEHISPYLEEITHAKKGIAILSNYCPKRIVYAQMRVPFTELVRIKNTINLSGEEVAKAITDTSFFAQNDVYRAVTHNKGISNGVNAVLAATGNDWRAQEAGSHAYAAKDGSYKPWSTWRIEKDELIGELTIPIQVGSVGGITGSHPIVNVALKIIGSASGKERTTTEELSNLCGAVGLAQNFVALYTLCTDGIYTGHVFKHARNYAIAAGVPLEKVDLVVSRMIEDKNVTDHYAKEIAKDYL